MYGFPKSSILMVCGEILALRVLHNPHRWGLWRTRRARISPHTIKMLDLGKPYNVHPPKAALTTVSEERGAWCRQVHRRTRSTKNCTPALG